MARRSRPVAVALGACGLAVAMVACAGAVRAAQEPAHPASLDEAIIRAAARHGVPESLVRRIVMRESKYNPRARNRAYWGLMQISYPTARSMGFHGSPAELLNPVVNLRYAVPYLANAFVIAGRHQEEAVRLYAAGYYFTARTRGLLGALRTADSAPLSGVPDEPDLAATTAPVTPAPESGGIFGALFGPSEMQRDPATQQAVYAQAQVQPPYVQPPSVQSGPSPQGTVMPAGRSGAEVTLVADTHGDLHPPRSWQRDGGTTVIARGEQAVAEIAAGKGVEAGDTGRRRHARKSTQFASLEAPATAQAYAAAPGQDPRLMQADSQAAISQVTAGQPQAVASQPQAAAPQAAAPQVMAEDATSKKSRRRHARHTRHRESEPETAVAAQSQMPEGQPPVLSSDQQAAAAPETQPLRLRSPMSRRSPRPTPGRRRSLSSSNLRVGPEPHRSVDTSAMPTARGGTRRPRSQRRPPTARRSRHRSSPCNSRKTERAPCEALSLFPFDVEG